MYKICTACHQEKHIEEFHFRKPPKRHSHCKECAHKKSREHYLKNTGIYISKSKTSKAKAMVMINELKKVPCTDCGNSFPTVCMDFDHVNDDKIEDVCTLAQRGNIKGALAEAAKCEIVCSNCHRIRTANRINHRRNERLKTLVPSGGIEPLTLPSA